MFVYVWVWVCFSNFTRILIPLYSILPCWPLFRKKCNQKKDHPIPSDCHQDSNWLRFQNARKLSEQPEMTINLTDSSHYHENYFLIEFTNNLLFLFFLHSTTFTQAKSTILVLNKTKTKTKNRFSTSFVNFFSVQFNWYSICWGSVSGVVVVCWFVLWVVWHRGSKWKEWIKARKINANIGILLWTVLAFLKISNKTHEFNSEKKKRKSENISNTE